MRDKTTTTIALIIGLLAFIQFIVMPISRQKSATKAIRTILSDWSEENMLSPMNYWANRDAYPNVPKLNSYKIRNQQIFKKDNVLFARFNIDLKFADNNYMPKNSEWLFALKKTANGWKVIDFRISRLHPSDIVKKEAVYDANADRQMLEQENSQTAPQQIQVAAEQPKTEPKPVEALKPIPKVVPVQPSDQGKRPGYKSIPALVK